MAATLEAIKGGGGSVKVGTVGTIGSLISRELESSSSTSHASSSVSQSTPISRSDGDGPLKLRKSMEESRKRSPEAVRRTRGQNLRQMTVSSPRTPTRQKQKAPLEDVGNNNSVSSNANRKGSDLSPKTRGHKRSHNIPMLGAENIHLEKTPVREKPTRRGYNVVDIVDVHCGNPGGSLSSRLKKLGFSKLSQSFI